MMYDQVPVAPVELGLTIVQAGHMRVNICFMAPSGAQCSCRHVVLVRRLVKVDDISAGIGHAEIMIWGDGLTVCATAPALISVVCAPSLLRRSLAASQD